MAHALHGVDVLPDGKRTHLEDDILTVQGDVPTPGAFPRRMTVVRQGEGAAGPGQHHSLQGGRDARPHNLAVAHGYPVAPGFVAWRNPPR